MTNDDYQKIITYLWEHQDIKYRDFHLSLKGASEMIGVKSDILKKIAKEISHHDYLGFIRLNQKKYYEEKAILAYLLGYLSIDFSRLTQLIDENIPFFDTWALTDGLCANLRIFKKNQAAGFKYIKQKLKSSNPFEIRIGLVLLLEYYISDQYIDEVLALCLKIKNDHYYVMMAKAWLVSVCYIKYPLKTEKILYQLDDVTKHKAISKINDSRRIKEKLCYKNYI